MKQTILIIGIIFLLVSFSIVSSTNNMVKDGDELDQYVTEMNWELNPVGQFPEPPYSNIILAQSFIPTKKILTRVEVLIGKNITTTYPFVINIKDNLTEENLATKSVDANDVTTEDFSWIEFDFSDILVVVNQPYYIICSTINESDNWYLWGGNKTAPYNNGSTFYSIDEQQTWYENPHLDLCFKTYGCDKNPPTPPIIDGPTHGTIGVEYTYTFNSTYENGIDFFYEVDWGDGTSESVSPTWPNPEEPGPGIANHSWGKKGTYIIKARVRDVWGYIGPWGELKVIMPRDKSISSSLLLRFLEQYPLLNRLLYLAGMI